MGRIISSQKKTYIIFVIAVTTTICLVYQTQNTDPFQRKFEYMAIGDISNVESSETNIKEWLENRKKYQNLSKLGRILFLDEEEPRVSTHKRYQILIWKYGPTIESRHLRKFSDKKINPFSYCPVKNCDITYKDSSISTADIVIFHLHRMRNAKDLPTRTRNTSQIWAFLTDESPHNTFLSSKVKINEFDGIFNWSMTYRMDSDIPVPYGRTVLRRYPVQFELNLKKKRDVLVAILGSNCGGRNHRWGFVKALQKYIDVDVFGKCGSYKTCPGHFKSDCPDIEKYLFYLSFENSNCDDYITEKVWWNAYQKNSIPIVMGAHRMNYKKLLPPNSYINVDDFASPAVLAQYIRRLNNTGEFQEYFQWKRDFRVLNEHGYFKSNSFHYCRICQALNYNDKKRKIYKKMEDFWDARKDCYPAWDA